MRSGGREDIRDRGWECELEVGGGERWVWGLTESK